MNRFLLTLTMILSAPFCAFAEGGDGHPEFFYQTHSGGQDLTGKISMSDISFDFKTSSDTDTALTTFSVEYEYGINDMMAVGVKLAQTQGEEKTSGSRTTDTSGLEDLEILFKGFSAAGPGQLRYGAVLEYALGENETESNGDTNRYSGGAELAPYVGYNMSSGSLAYGAKLSLALELMAKEYKSGSVKGEREGYEETALSLFVENKFNEDVLLGAALTYASYSDLKTKPDNGASTTTEALSPVYTLDLYVPVRLGPGKLLPEFSYAMSNDDKVGGVKLDAYTATKFELGYRLEF